jgi:hypothetical protein
MGLEVRKLLTCSEETRTEGARSDGPPLRKAAALAVLGNPYAGQPYATDLAAITDHGAELGELLARTAVAVLGAEVQSYGKAALAGVAGEQEHAVACTVGPFGIAVRDAVGGGASQWISSVTKRCSPGVAVDVPLASSEDLWVRSHYDAFTVVAPDAPLPDEIVVIVAVASRGRLNARVGGRTLDEARRAAP